MTAQERTWAPPCPVCGRPVRDTGAGPCPACGLPAAAQAALVVARIGATLTDLARDRDALLATLRTAAPGAAAPADVAGSQPQTLPPPRMPLTPPAPPAPADPAPPLPP
ncbi:MAG: hypothetical protein M3P89_11230, partial [Actinomycetota bacterium]|nr:hypothetical protein [Actinomycetota bacterium]